MPDSNQQTGPDAGRSMDDVNPYASPRESSVEARTKPWTPITVNEAVRLGAWLGLKWTTYITGPFANRA